VESTKNLGELDPGTVVMCRDFNEVLTDSKKMEGNTRRYNFMQAFRETLEVCDLMDLGYFGPKYTWSNGQERTALIKERLDRGVSNIEWRNLFPKAELQVESTICSDHAPLKLQLWRPNRRKRSKAWFYFEADWALDEGCKEALDLAWKKEYAGKTYWARLNSKLEAYIHELMGWKKNVKDKGEQAIQQLPWHLRNLQEKEDPRFQTEEKQVRSKLQKLLDSEELWWRQRAKADWLKSGDRNTCFFHACANERKRHNTVGSITDKNGTVWDIIGGVEDAFTNYFTSLFTQGQGGDFSSCL
jgi:hypothetical protein